MSFALNLLALSTLGDVANSPMIVPVAGCLMTLGIVVAAIWAGVRTREVRAQERLAAIAKGLPPDIWAESTPAGTAAPANPRPNNGAGARRTGIILTSIGIGLIAFFVALAAILVERDVLCGAATGLVPFAVGIGFLIDGRLRRAEYERALANMPGTAPFTPAENTRLTPLH